MCDECVLQQEAPADSAAARTCPDNIRAKSVAHVQDVPACNHCHQQKLTRRGSLLQTRIHRACIDNTPDVGVHVATLCAWELYGADVQAGLFNPNDELSPSLLEPPGSLKANKLSEAVRLPMPSA